MRRKEAEAAVRGRKKFYMLVGLPGSGKTSYAKEMLAAAETEGRQIAWISSDRIRGELYGSEEEQRNPAKVFDEMRLRTVEALCGGSDVIYDACNINSKKRKAFLAALKRFDCEKICLIAATPYAVCLERNAQRSRKVPEQAIERMYTAWWTPAPFEGWDQIRLCYAPGSEGLFGEAEAFAEKYMAYDQTNPHHLETLGEHVRRAGAYLREKGVDANANLIAAAMLHDCGKPFTRSLEIKENGRKVAHYYRHENVGSYDALFYDLKGRGKTEQDILEISILIGLHMTPFSWKKTDGHAKKRELWGDALYEKVKLLNEADIASKTEERSV